MLCRGSNVDINSVVSYICKKTYIQFYFSGRIQQSFNAYFFIHMQVNNKEISSEVNCKTILPLFKGGDELMLMVARSLSGGIAPFH